MSTPVHVSAVLDGSNPAQADRILLGVVRNLANVAGSGAGASVVIPLPNLFPSGELPSDGSYVVSVDAGQPCIASASAKTSTGFTLTLTPYPSTATLAAGKVQINVEA